MCTRQLQVLYTKTAIAKRHTLCNSSKLSIKNFYCVFVRCNRLESVILLKVCKISAVQIIEEIFINYQRTLISKQKDESDSRKEMRERT